MPETIIKLANISKSYSQGDTVIPVIDNLDVSIQEGKFTAVIGPSGSGKSTLLNVIGLIDTADRGDIFLFNENLKDLKASFEKDGYYIIKDFWSLKKCNDFIKIIEKYSSLDFAPIMNPDRDDFLMAQCANKINDFKSLSEKTNFYKQLLKDSRGIKKFIFDKKILSILKYLKGKRVGIYMGAFNINHEVDSIMYEAIEYIKNQGAEVIVIDSLMNSKVLQNSFLVMLYEYKKGLNEYFKSLGKNTAIKSINELINFNETDSIELKYFNQKYLYMTNGMGDLSSEEYINSLEFALQESRKNGIDRVMDKHNLDGLIAQTGGPAWQTDLVHGDRYELGSSSPAAISGYPSITVPMGNIKGLPVGISFFGKAWSEPTLIEMAYAFEYGTKHRIIPKFISTDSISIN